MAFLWNPWNVLTRMRRRRRKKMTLSVHAGRDDLIATNATLLNIKYELYGFNGDLIEAIN